MRIFPAQVGPGGEPVSDTASWTSSNANDSLQEAQNAITSSGQTLIPLANPANNTQLSQAMARYASGGVFGVDSGAADAYVISTTGSFTVPDAYFDGMKVGFFAANANTGASTINAFGIGVVDLVQQDGTALSAAFIDTIILVEAQYDSGAGKFFVISSVGTGATAVVPAFENQLLHIREEQASGVAAGTFTSGSYQTRVLNTVLTNQISGASLSSNQITLDAGTYFIDGLGPSYSVGNNKLKLRDTTGAADLIFGQSAFGAVNGTGDTALLSDTFTLGVTSVLELQHRGGVTKATDGFGRAAGFGDIEVYAEVKIWKVG